MRVEWKLVMSALAVFGTASHAAQSVPVEPRVEQALAALEPTIQVAGRDYEPIAIEELMRRNNVPAVSIALVRDGRIAWTKAYGVADPVTGRVATPETLFQSASISKPVAAMAALDLVEQGRLDLDKPINEQLTSWRLPDSPAADGEAVTLRRLLTHTAGLTVSGFPGYEPGMPLPSVSQILDGTAPANTDPVRIDIKPGSRWRYSGGGITVAQLMMTDVTGEPFPALMDRLVLRPLGMARSTFAQPLPTERGGEAAVAHLGDGKPIEGGYHVYPEMAAAGLWTTPSDLARWALALSASFNGHEGGVLEPETAAAMLTPAMGDWGLGLAVEGEGEWLNFSHGGSNEGYKANLSFYPRKGEGLIVMTNGDRGAAVMNAVNHAVGRMLGWPDSEPRRITPVTISAEERSAVVGRYEDEDIFALVAQGGDMLTIAPGGRNPIEIIPQGKDAFVSPVNGMRFQFERDSSGRVIAIEGAGRKLKRVAEGS